MFSYSPPQAPDSPLDDSLMVFFSHEEFSHNPLAFWEYIVNNTSYKAVWVAKSEEMFNKMSEAGISYCRYASEDMYQCLSSARYVFMDGRQPIIWQPPQGQLVVQLSAAITFSYDVFTVPDYPKAYYDSLRSLKYMDMYSGIATASSPVTRIITAASYGYDARKIFVTGLPRTDAIFYDDAKDLLLSEFPELEKYKKIILYTPGAKTMSDGGPQISNGRYANNLFNLDDFEQEEFERFLEKNNTAIVFKMHPFDEYRIGVRNFPSPIPKHCYIFHTNSFFGKTHYHIFNAFDCMISDTSSTAYEYLLLDRPIIFSHNEIDLFHKYSSEYIINDESLVYPGRRAYTFHELMNAITEALETPLGFSEERKRTRQLLHTYTDGKSCERLLKLIESYDFENPVENIEYEMYTQNLVQERDGLKMELDNAQTRFSSLEFVHTGLIQDHNILTDERNNLTQERDTLTQERSNLIAELDNAQTLFAGLKLEHGSLMQEYNILTNERNNLTNERNNLVNELVDTHNRLDAILASRGYRFSRKIISWVCPLGSVRRKVIGKMYRILRD